MCQEELMDICRVEQWGQHCSCFPTQGLVGAGDSIPFMLFNISDLYGWCLFFWRLVSFPLLSRTPQNPRSVP